MSVERLNKMARAISKRSGISTATIEVVLRAAFDEWRQQLSEGSGVVAVESFGIITVKQLPARKYHYHRPSKGIDEWRDLPGKKVLKFIPTRNLRLEVERGQYDPTRTAFTRHPDDPRPRCRASVKHKKLKAPISKDGQTSYEKPATDNTDSTD